jgi:hypothetical protein
MTITIEITDEQAAAIQIIAGRRSKFSGEAITVESLLKKRFDEVVNAVAGRAFAPPATPAASK